MSGPSNIQMQKTGAGSGFYAEIPARFLIWSANLTKRPKAARAGCVDMQSSL
jgi:hypothetical protein